MTRYKRKNNKTRKIKKMKGGDEKLKVELKEIAIETVNEKIKKMKGVDKGNETIFVDYYQRLFEDDKKFKDINPFYNKFRIEQFGKNTEDSIAGVEELFPIFKKELEYYKTPTHDKKILPIKTKSIQSDYNAKRGLHIEEPFEEPLIKTKKTREIQTQTDKDTNIFSPPYSRASTPRNVTATSTSGRNTPTSAKNTQNTFRSISFDRR
jgi:hypothetical protein